jgi:hypothetical protein
MKAVAVHGNWWADLCEAESKLVMTSTHGGPPLEPPALPPRSSRQVSAVWSTTAAILLNVLKCLKMC